MKCLKFTDRKNKIQLTKKRLSHLLMDMYNSYVIFRKETKGKVFIGIIK